jgi:hypothetical protein
MARALPAASERDLVVHVVTGAALSGDESGWVLISAFSVGLMAGASAKPFQLTIWKSGTSNRPKLLCL